MEFYKIAVKTGYTYLADPFILNKGPGVIDADRIQKYRDTHQLGIL